MAIEDNVDAWREIRARVDSTANAVFLLAGGALSLFISVLIDKKSAGAISPQVATHAIWSWYVLLAAMVLFLLLKGHLIWQSYLLQFHTDFLNKHLSKLNITGWVIGSLGFISFVWGMLLLASAASSALTAAGA